MNLKSRLFLAAASTLMLGVAALPALPAHAQGAAVDAKQPVINQPVAKEIAVKDGLVSSAAASKDSPDASAQMIGLSGAGGIGEMAKNVEINTSNVYDYTFSAAPTDWKVQSGVWEMTNRWSCSPQWSWLGGRSEEVAAIWNKRRFSGDQSIQFYFAFKMGLAGTPRWTYHPSDVALSFCGDGKNLGSGYTLILGADGNTRSVLMKGGKVVAESKEKAALLPAMTDGMPPTNDLHRHWWYVRVNKIGDRVECYLDNQLILTYVDSKPLDFGQVALWTYNNGIMLSRVQIYYENEVRGGKILEAKTSAPAKPATPTTIASLR